MVSSGESLIIRLFARFLEGACYTRSYTLPLKRRFLILSSTSSSFVYGTTVLVCHVGQSGCHICMYMYVYVCIYVYIYIYIYRDMYTVYLSTLSTAFSKCDEEFLQICKSLGQAILKYVGVPVEEIAVVVVKQDH